MLRRWAEVTFVLEGSRGEERQTAPAHVGLRLLKPQCSHSADDSDLQHHAVVRILA